MLSDLTGARTWTDVPTTFSPPFLGTLSLQGNRISKIKNVMPRPLSFVNLAHNPGLKADAESLERTQFDLKSREYQQRITEMHGALQLAKQEAERQQIGVRTVDEMTTQEVLQEAGKVQDQSLAAITRMKQNIAQSKEVGAATASATCTWTSSGRCASTRRRCLSWRWSR